MVKAAAKKSHMTNGRKYGFAKGPDPRRHKTPKGVRYSSPSGKTVRSDFITQQLLAKLHDPYNPKAAKKDQRPYYAKLVDKTVKLALEGNERLIQFIWERIEGRVPTKVEGKIDHMHHLDEVLPFLNKQELALLEKVSRKSLELEGIKVIEHIPGER